VAGEAVTGDEMGKCVHRVHATWVGSVERPELCRAAHPAAEGCDVRGGPCPRQEL